MSDIKIYTDGACSGNPGPGGWGAVLLSGKHRKDISGTAKNTTNNRMELSAVIESLKLLKNPSEITIYTDSKYVMDGITKWIFNWKKNGWKGSNKKPVKNVDLWQDLDKGISQHKAEWIWVKGHSGDFYNEVADDLARNASLSIK